MLFQKIRKQVLTTNSYYNNISPAGKYTKKSRKMFAHFKIFLNKLKYVCAIDRKSLFYMEQNIAH